MENKKGAFCMAAGFLLVLAALLLTGYNEIGRASCRERV